MKPARFTCFFLILFLFGCHELRAQLVSSPFTTAQALAQKLVGDGITISNVTFTGSLEMAGFFTNLGGTNIGIDSGIVLTSGRVAARSPFVGLSGNSGANASNNMGQPGDLDLSTIISEATNDACILQFDFVPLGDSIRFNYVFSSEEYPEYACGGFNDGFAFLISGPGITGKKNLALIPNTNFPVTIDNINNVPGCGLFPQYYIDNSGNSFFTHDGLTTVLTAAEKVEPCKTYTLKLVIADAGLNDFIFDSGVFLQAKSLTSNVVSLNNIQHVDQSGNSYLAEGCNSYSFVISRPRKDPTPLNVGLQYTGTATNGVDVQLLPSSVIIPAFDCFVVVNVVPIQDGIPEGVETLKIYALGGCNNNIPADSMVVQIRDYEILNLLPDTTFICNHGSIQLVADPTYTTYQWDPDPTLSSTTISNPIASPVVDGTKYTCTATTGTCSARDSAFIRLKLMEFVSKTDVNCKNGNTGVIKVGGGPEWTQPVSFSLDGINWQPDSTFTNLPAGNYWVKMKDANCIDSVNVTLVQAFPDLVMNTPVITPASCTGGADGTITINATGGSNPILYSLDNISFQPSNVFSQIAGTYTVYIKDNNGCSDFQPAIIPLNNTVTLDAGADAHICLGRSYQILATSNGTSFLWTPAATLDNGTIQQPTATPATDTKYYITATTGVCTQVDSMTVFIRPSPVADAGADIKICYGKTFTLNGSGGATYSWTPATYLTTPTNIAAPSGKATASLSYFLTVTDATGCVSLSPDEVKVDVTPSVKIFAGNDTLAAINQPIQLRAVELSNAGVTQYQWTPAASLDNPNIANPIATLGADEHFIVTGTTPEGCEGKDDIIIKVYKGPDIYVPTAFTPNNDGRNDVLKAIPVGIKQFKYLVLYNRWGQAVFRTEDYSRGWDGTIKGVAEPTGTYIWVTEGIDYKGNLISRKGVVTLIR